MRAARVRLGGRRGRIQRGAAGYMVKDEPRSERIDAVLKV